MYHTPTKHKTKSRTKSRTKGRTKGRTKSNTKSRTVSRTKSRTVNTHRSKRKIPTLTPSKDMDIVSYENVELPHPIPSDHSDIKEHMDLLQSIGKRIKNPNYVYGRYTMFIYIYLIKKYSSSCAIFNHEYFLHGAILNYNIITNKLIFPRELGKQMVDCIHRGTEIIFITLFMTDEINKIEHVNILIYRPFKKIIERYEPHGRQTMLGVRDYDEESLNTILATLFEKTFRDDLKEYTPDFKTPADICPSMGFQAIESRVPTFFEDGYCQLWDMFIMETILMNPTLNTINIIDRCLEVGKKQPLYFKRVIRGYTYQIAKDLELYLKPYVKTRLGTKESVEQFKHINISQLVKDTLFETSSRRKTMPKIEPFDNEAGLTNPDMYLYIQYLTQERVPEDKLDKSEKYFKTWLRVLMARNKLTWRELTHDIYDFFFDGLSEKKVKQLAYYVDWGEYPPEAIDLSYIHPRLSSRKKSIRADYPKFHKFYFDYQLAMHNAENRRLSREDMQNRITEINKLDDAMLFEFCFLIEFNMIVSMYDKKDPIYIAFREHENDIRYLKSLLYSFLESNDLIVEDLVQWYQMF
jgi:hypothetical protein